MKNKIRLSALCLVLCFAMTALYTGSARTALAEEGGLQVAALKGPTGMGLAYVITEEGSDDTVELYDAPDAVTAKFLSGEVDVAAVPVNLASVLYNKTQGDTVVLAVNTLGVLYILDSGDTLQSLSDLAGRRLYATGQGSTPEHILNYILKGNGLTDVEVEYVGEHAVLAQMVAAGEAELAMLPEPQVSAALLKAPSARAAIDLTEEWSRLSDTPLVQGVYIARRSTYEARRNEIDAFMDRVAGSVEKVNTEADAAEVVAAAGVVPNSVIAGMAIPRANIVCIRGGEMKDAVSGMLAVLYEAQPSSVGGALPGADFYVIENADEQAA